MAREHRRVLTVEEARNLPPPSEAELAERRAALRAAADFSAELERRHGAALSLDLVLAAATDDDEA